MCKKLFASILLVLSFTIFAEDAKPQAEIVNLPPGDPSLQLPLATQAPAARDTLPPVAPTTKPVGTTASAAAQTMPTGTAGAPGNAPGNANATATVTATAPPWLAMVLGILGAIWTGFAWPWVQAHISSLKATAAAQQINMNTSLLSQRQIIFNNVLAYVAEHSLLIAQNKFPALAADILAGKYRDPNYIRAELASWGEAIKQDTIAYFANGGIDVVKVMGTKALDDLIAAAAAKISPFPGKDIAVELLDDKVVPMLLNYGVDWVRKYYLGAHTDAEINLARSLGHLPVEKEFKMEWNKPVPTQAVVA